MSDFILQNLGLIQWIAGIIVAGTIWWTSANFTNMSQNSDICKLDKRLSDLEKKEQEYRDYKQMAHEHRERIVKLENNDRQRDVDIAEIKSRLASIETNIFWIKDALIQRQNDGHITYK